MALAHAPLLHWALRSSSRIVGSADPALAATLVYSAGLSGAALVTWLAYERFDTGARVTLLPRRWTDVGWGPLLVFLVAETAHTALVFSCSPAELQDLERIYVSTYVADGQLLIAWLLAAELASALAEELVYRAMLLRALEGYTADPRTALVLHAVVFELAHLYGYGLEFSGGFC